jgi:hypothetical protein
MNDPHVVALHYRIKHTEYCDYNKAPPLEHDEAGFSIRVEKNEARVVMKSHHATSESARDVVESFLRAWELSAALSHATAMFEFVFQSAEIIDRKPTPGQLCPQGITAGSPSIGVPDFHVARNQYPDPPSGLARDTDVDLMFDCYRMWCTDRRRLSDACYFCLTVLERAAGNRKRAAVRFGIDHPVLDKIGNLTAKKGGNEARKALGAHTGFTSREQIWLQEVLKLLVRRAAEVAHDPNAALNKIVMSNLPPIP